MTTGSPTPTNVRAARRSLLLIAAFFFVPLIASFVLYYGHLWRPQGGTNKGDLITPARPLPSVAIALVDGTRSSTDGWHGKWTWLYIGDGQCDARCRAALTDTRQARLLLAEKMTRVQRAFFATDHCCDSAYLKTEQPDLIVAKLDNPDLIATFPLYNNVPLANAGRIYLIDPLGNLMMSYAPDTPGMGILDDVKKLLNLSHIG